MSMKSVPVDLNTLNENHYLALRGIGDPALGEIVVTVSEMYKDGNDWFIRAMVGFCPAGGRLTVGFHYNAPGSGFVQALKMMGAPVIIWFINGCRVYNFLGIPGMPELLQAVGRA